MNKLFWCLYFIISQRFAHLFKWASSGQCFQPQNMYHTTNKKQWVV